LNAFEPDDILSQMSLEEKVGQLFVIPACQLREQAHIERVAELIHTHHIGSIILKQGTIQGQLDLIDRLKSCAKIPPLFFQDTEWGLGMRLSDGISFPKNLTLGAIQNEDLITELGREIGAQCKSAGIDVTLAPVVDVNTNPRNPIIHRRSFGEDPDRVARLGLLMMRGIQSMGVWACAKHFPGHGDTSIDSHQDLPFLAHTFERLQQVELKPFQAQIDGGVAFMMSAHLQIPHVDPQFPATFSEELIRGILKQEMGFEGLMITDALNMQGITRFYSDEDAAVGAIRAGHDLLLYGTHIAPRVDQILFEQVPKAYQALIQAYQEDRLSLADLDRSVLKILKTRKKNLHAIWNGQIDWEKALLLKQRLFNEAITLIGELPSFERDSAYLGSDQLLVFEQELVKELGCRVLTWDQEDLIEKLEDYPLLMISVCSVEPRFLKLLETLEKKNIEVVVILFGTPYALAEIPSGITCLVAYEQEVEAERAAAAVMSGKLPAIGKLPITINRTPSGRS
jgi:beta-glucosidase-like glycosyl hydrolase